MAEPTLAQILPVALEAVARASAMLRAGGPGKISMKSDRNPVTDVDFAVEREIRAFLRQAMPSIGFIGEEEGRRGETDSELIWALDPVDGTVNFMHGVPLCAVSLGLCRNDVPTLGVIELPFMNMTYSAYLDHGAFSGSDRISASSISEIADAVVALGDYAVGEDAPSKNEERLELTSRLAADVQRIRMLGSAATDLAWVAEGRIDASVMLSNKPWDTAAGVLLAREAGALVVDRFGREHTSQSTSTVAVAPQLREPLLTVLCAVGQQDSDVGDSCE